MPRAFSANLVCIAAVKKLVSACVACHSAFGVIVCAQAMGAFPSTNTSVEGDWKTCNVGMLYAGVIRQLRHATLVSSSRMWWGSAHRHMNASSVGHALSKCAGRLNVSMPGAVKYWFTAACFSSQTVGLVITDVLQQHCAEKALGEAAYQVSINPASDCSAPMLLGGAGAWPQ